MPDMQPARPANPQPVTSKPDPNAPISLTPDALRTLVEEIKKPYVDREAEARKTADRDRLRRDERDRLAAIAAAQEACPHVREDNSSAIAWYPFSSPAGSTVMGVCQRCNLTLKPGHPRYEALMRIPTRTGVMNGLV